VSKKQKGITQGSPVSSAPSTPRKSATAERIAQEKARLKKLEHELSEKLRLYAHSRQEDEAKTHPSVSPKKASQINKDISDVTQSGIEEKQPGPDGAISDNSNNTLSERQNVDSEQTDLLLERQRAVASPRDSEMAEAIELNINAQQLERVRKLQVSVPMYTNCKSQTYKELYLHPGCVIYSVCSGTQLIKSPTGYGNISVHVHLFME